MIVHEVKGSEDSTKVAGLEVSLVGGVLSVGPGTYHRGDGSYSFGGGERLLDGQERACYLARDEAVGSLALLWDLGGGIDPAGYLVIDRLAWREGEEWHAVKVMPGVFCPLCSQSFWSREERRSHLQAAHPGEEVL